MSDVETSVEIDASPEAVWAVLTDLDRLGEWMEAHDGFEDLPRKMRRGVEFRQRISHGDLEAEVEWTVEAVERPVRLAWSGHGPAGARAHVSYHLEPCGDDRTLLGYRTDFELPGGRLAGIAGSAVLPRGQEEAERALERLRRLVEADAGPPG